MKKTSAVLIGVLLFSFALSASAGGYYYPRHYNDCYRCGSYQYQNYYGAYQHSPYSYYPSYPTYYYPSYNYSYGYGYGYNQGYTRGYIHGGYIY